jgi:hypothetical protein
MRLGCQTGVETAIAAQRPFLGLCPPEFLWLKALWRPSPTSLPRVKSSGVSPGRGTAMKSASSPQLNTGEGLIGPCKMPLLREVSANLRLSRALLFEHGHGTGCREQALKVVSSEFDVYNIRATTITRWHNTHANLDPTNS